MSDKIFAIKFQFPTNRKDHSDAYHPIEWVFDCQAKFQVPTNRKDHSDVQIGTPLKDIYSYVSIPYEPEGSFRRSFCLIHPWFIVRVSIPYEPEGSFRLGRGYRKLGGSPFQFPTNGKDHSDAIFATTTDAQFVESFKSLRTGRIIQTETHSDGRNTVTIE